MKNLKNIVLLCVAAVALAACTKTTTIRASNDYQIVVAKAQNISLLPAVVESNSIDAGGKATRNHNYEGQVEEIISDMLVTKLREKGYHVKYINKREIHDLKASKNTFAVQEEYLNQIRAL